MAVLITGGHGHIASWTALLLATEGQELILYDTQDQAPDYLNAISGNITFVRGDVMDYRALTGVFEKYRGKIDGIIHTVGVMGEMVLSAPRDNVAMNVMGLVNLIELARVFEIAKVVYTSTGAVYGVVEGLPAEDRLPNPTDLYAATKVSAEYLGRQYEHTFGIDFRIARLFFVYGPGKYPSEFIKLYQVAFGALQGLKDLKMDMGADQKLDFTYVEDAARGVALLYNAADLKHKIFNIATGKAHTVAHVAALARKYTHFPVGVEIGPGELMRRSEALDISRRYRSWDTSQRSDSMKVSSATPIGCGISSGCDRGR
jgi:nucleoside-diphosphate-sugar epimerase